MTILFAWLWQGVALALLTALLLRALPHVNAATRHVAWWASLLAVLGIPLVLATALQERIPRLPLPGGDDQLEAALVLPVFPGWVGVVCMSAWAIAALSGLARVALGCCLVQTLKKESVPFDPVREGRLPLWAGAQSRPGRGAALRTSPALAGACALGFRRPVILVGRTLADGLDDEALDQIVMHEQAHLARYDDWLQLIQAILRSVAGLHPAVWWLSRRIDLDREAACDDRVVFRTGAVRQYASALLEAAAITAPHPMARSIAPGAIARASALRLRVSRLLDRRRAHGTRATPIAVLAMMVPMLVVAASPQLAPLVAFVDAVEHALPLQLPGGSSFRSGATSSVPATVNGTRVSAVMPVQTTADRRPIAAPTPDRTAGAERAAEPLPSTPQEPAAPVEAGALAPLESRAVVTDSYASLSAAVSTGTIDDFRLPMRGQPSAWQALTISSTRAARSSASAIASGAERGGGAIGRAFTRAGRAIAAGH